MISAAPLELRTHRFGVNYTPSRHWYYCWNDFDADAIARDFDAIAALGLDHLRVMTIWPWFQPNPSWVSPAHLRRLEALLDLAAARNLDVCVTAFTGHLTGYQFVPAYLKGRDFYTDPTLRNTQRQYLEALADVGAGRSHFLGIDLGNEMNCAWKPASREDGDAWMDWALGVCEASLPGGVHVNGVDHQPWFIEQGFSPAALTGRQSMVPLHCWIEFTYARRRGGVMDEVCVGLAAAMTRLARSYAGDAALPIWLQEYGASEAWMEASLIPAFLEATTRRAIDAGVSWFTWWASHDIDRQLQVDELEYTLGLLDVNNRPKPQARTFAELAKAYRGKPVVLPAEATPTPLHDDTGLSYAATWRWLEARLTSDSAALVPSPPTR